MPEKLTFKVAPRTIKGKKVKSLRQEGIVPANVVAESAVSTMIEVDRKSFKHLYDKAGDTTVIYLQVGESQETVPVLVEQVEVHPVTNETQHIVFRQVNLKEKIEAQIPVELVGENKVPDAVVITVHDEIEVRALPTDLPEKFEIDISVLTEIGQAVTFADLKFDREKVELILEEDLETPVVMLQEVKEEVIEEVAAPEGEEGTETAGGETPAEGEAPAEEGEETAKE